MPAVVTTAGWLATARGFLAAGDGPAIGTMFVVVFNARRFEPAGVVDCGGLARDTGTTALRLTAGAVWCTDTGGDGRFNPAGDGCLVVGDGRFGDGRFGAGRAAATAGVVAAAAAARCCFLSAIC
jgi:hypothetical protein